MITFIKLFATFLGFVFPVVLIKAIRCERGDPQKDNYTALSSICFGTLIFILMLFMPSA